MQRESESGARERRAWAECCGRSALPLDPLAPRVQHSPDPLALPLHAPARARSFDGAVAFVLPGIPILPARTRRLQAAAGASRRWLLACARSQPGPGTPEPAGLEAGVQVLRAGKVNMLRIYPVVLEVLRGLQPLVRRIEVKDRDLGRQLRRCSSSVALNLAEGMYSRGHNRSARYHSALGSARETLACLEVAEVCGYARGDVALHQHLNQVIGTLVRLVKA